MKKKDTKLLICDTYCTLAQRSPEETISVKKLIHASGLNRSTFYYHFRDINDVAEQIMRGFSQKYIHYILLLSDCKTEEDPAARKYLQESLWPELSRKKAKLPVFFTEKFRETFKALYFEAFQAITEQYGSLIVQPYGLPVDEELDLMQFIRNTLCRRSFEKMEFWICHSPEKVDADFFRLYYTANVEFSFTRPGN